VAKALRSPEFAAAFLTKVVGEHLGAENPLERPAEYYVQKPDWIIQANPGYYGVEFRLTGTTRNGRTPAQFHKALKETHALVKATIREALVAAKSGQRIQMFCVIMLDDSVEIVPGSGKYSNIIEAEAEWIAAE